MRPLVLLLLFVLLAGGCASSGIAPEMAFANKLAVNGLWQEAIYRWQQVLARNPGNAAAHNNLAVAYEKLGRFTDAEQEYRQALKLAPKSSRIQSNFAQFRKSLEGEKDEKK